MSAMMGAGAGTVSAMMGAGSEMTRRRRRRRSVVERSRRRRRRTVIGRSGVVYRRGGRAVHNAAGFAVHGRARFTVYGHGRSPQDVQRASHKIHDVRGQTDPAAAVSVMRPVVVMISGKRGGPDDDGCSADGGFKDRVLHFSSPVLEVFLFFRCFLIIKRFDFRIIVLCNDFFRKFFFCRISGPPVRPVQRGRKFP